MKKRGLFLPAPALLALAVFCAGCQAAGGGGDAGSPPATGGGRSPKVNGVAVSPGRIALGKGVTQRFVAAVTGGGAVNGNVVWTVTGASDPDTVIGGNGILSVAPGETASVLTVEARSVSDRLKYGTSVALLIGNDRFPEENGITLSPPVITVSRGSRQTFGAALSATGAAAAGLAWSVQGSTPESGTTIADGALTVGAGEPASVITVKAEQGARYGTAIVYIGENGGFPPDTGPYPSNLGLEVRPPASALDKGGLRTFSAYDGEGDEVADADWTLPGEHAGSTYNSGAAVHIGDGETAEKIKVRAEAAGGVGEAVISVRGNGTAPDAVNNGVEIVPAAASVAPGGSRVFQALDSINGGVPTVTWRVTGGGAGTYMSTTNNGELFVGQSETAAYLTLRAERTDSGRYGTAVVKVTDEPEETPADIPAEVSGIRVTPGIISLARGSSGTKFTALGPEGNGVTGVSWTLETGGGGAAAGGTVIGGSSGELDISAAEALARVIVRAASGGDYGTAVVYVGDTGESHPVDGGITVYPASADVPAGGFADFSARLSGTETGAPVSWWSLDTPDAEEGTGITGAGGRLTVSAEEDAEKILVVRAITSDGKYGTAVVTVKEALPVEEPGTGVTEVTVSPASATVRRGEGQTFSAYDGQNTTPVTWSVSGGGQGGTSIGADGVLYVGANEPASGLTVTAVSAENTDIYGEAAVYVPTVNGVTVNETGETVPKGSNRQFTAAVDAEGGAAVTVTWSVETQGVKPGTGFTGSTLYVDSGETTASVTIRATSTEDNTKYGEAAVTVPQPTVTGVTVSPSTAGVAKGDTRQFSALVTGTDSPSQAVTWSVTGGGGGTGISDGGELTVASDEAAASLTVRATSVADGTKSGTAAVTVLPATKDITGFSINGIAGGIDSAEKTVTVTLPYGTNLTGLSPLITHNGVSVSPASGVPQDFTNPVFYTVTAKDSLTAEWRVRVDLGPLDTIALIDAYLSGASGGGSANSPVPLPAALNLSSEGEGWAALLSKIKEKGKYVALDLSACAMSGAEFNPGSANTGENRIASLVLPAPAESIKAGTSNSPTFRYFTDLKNVSGANVTAVGDYAFSNRGALATVSLPKAASIGDYAFANCDALETVSLPKAASISGGAFYSCGALETVDLPVAASVGNRAFEGCGDLATLNIPSVTSIGIGAFQDTEGQALTITMGQAAPSVSASSLNASRTFSKNVTIRTPASPSGYGETWQTDFKKAFGVSYGSYTVDISLGFQTITQ